MDARTHSVSVFDAGEVQIERSGDTLRIVSITPNAGWTYEEDTEAIGKIELEFHSAGREAEFEAEIDDGRLKIEIENEWEDAAEGVYQVGDAGEVEIRRDGETLTLVAVRPNEGWDYSLGDGDDEDVEEEDDEEADGSVARADMDEDGDEEEDVEEEDDEDEDEPEIVIEFEKGDQEAEFEAGISGGKIQVEIELEFYADDTA